MSLSANGRRNKLIDKSRQKLYCSGVTESNFTFKDNIDEIH